MTVGQEVVEHFHRMVASDGSRIELIEETEKSLRVRYAKGENACETCVMEPEDLQGMILEVVQRKNPAITEVELETA